MMTEYGYGEKPILEWLAGNPRDPDDRGIGWTFRSEEQMAEYDRPLTDPLVEKLLIPALSWTACWSWLGGMPSQATGRD